MPFAAGANWRPGHAMMKTRNQNRADNPLERALLWIAAAAFAVVTAMASLPPPERLVPGALDRSQAGHSATVLESQQSPALRAISDPARLRSE